MKNMNHTTTKNWSNHRRDYQRASLELADLLANPLDMIALWVEQASDLPDATAMVLSTCANQQPSSRVVLLKEITPNGLVWFTNYNSQKGCELAANPAASLLFFWATLERQIRIEGRVEKISPEQSDTYFHERPIASQLSAWASPQSQKIASREQLEQLLVEVQTRFSNQTIVRPEHWGGYCLVPNRVEFWQGGLNRLHDRLVYQQSENADWQIDRLAP
jgi:pyridoxamine 5'-phosphate oxidase